eukprot:TRINITY_DN11284_c0_g1_i1.p3 TRINITY_DN11284_c0_g1~~TRINITY_DN11284_c0_g1_i1.p3  ORF type:complete len:183 (+),score=29.87 TRINITY_DN11284_c0_g1_i1:133-681(+)
MRTYDLSPLLRSSIGFDRFDWLFDAASRLEDGSTGYPPYNIEKLEGDKYAVTLAVAGFAQDELAIVQHDTTLVVSGKGSEQPKAGDREGHGVLVAFQLLDVVGRVAGAAVFQAAGGIEQPVEAVEADAGAKQRGEIVGAHESPSSGLERPTVGGVRRIGPEPPVSSPVARSAAPWGHPCTLR